MFVHARSSRFNQRTPRQGPDMHQRHEFAHKQPLLVEATNKPAPPPSSSPTSSKESLLLLRPIATNSRIKQHKNLYIVFVNNALQQLERGDADPFDELVAQFSSKSLEDGTTSTHQLRQWLNALSHVVSQFARPHAALVDAVVSLPWYTMDDGLVKTYKSFIAILVSAKPEYLHPVLNRTAHSLTYQSGLKPMGGQDETPLTRGAMFDRLHSLLQSLLELIPTLPSTLQPLLAQHFPHKRQNKLSHVTYIRNILRVSDYCPGVAEEILATIIDRAIQIDVEMEELEAEGAGAEPEVFALDPFENIVGEHEPDSDSDDEDGDDAGDLSDLSSEAEDLEADPKKINEPRDMAHIKEMVVKLDSILQLLFEHFARLQAEIASDASRPVPADRERLLEARHAQFLSLVTIFDTTILRTFKSRYTQFLVFWYASLDAEFADLFLGMLLSRALREHAQPPVTRAAAASYVASLVSRALFIDRAATRRVTEFFCTYLEQHLATATGYQQHTHTIFYAVAQAVFLIFCFRWRDLLMDDDHENVEDEEMELGHARKRRWLPQLDVMHRAVMSPLNPLKVCSQNVVAQFARVAQHTDFMYCYPIMEGSATPSASESGPSNSATAALFWAGAEQELHSFFPFDPYALPLSASFVQGIYRDWAMVAIDDEDDDDDEEEEEDSDAEAEARDDPTAQLGASFGGMSISPVQPRVLSLAAATVGVRFQV
ncbi:RNA polymerase I-specific transcription initiation factor RRN3 [Exidia glandulosa HHB12029]|uniref:RNA polymerase I-specific transcription initiation factor RRN3 n=1 Tax=Exidia glandulosa HHB12029 TaxID=1314781 RepID=A0A165J230_EXIGL|nr:RNA polymerase I-specific transcription initiation factor RRN3 [Exidia glandulosa HHB12029]